MKKLPTIKCQAVHSKTNGCLKCGGYRVLLQKYNCPRCTREFWDWMRPGTTVYEGKTVTSFDGVELVWNMDTGFQCYSCVKLKKRRQL